MRRLAAALVALLWAASAAAQPAPNPARALAEARAKARDGDPDGALQIIQSILRGPGLSPGDVAALHLEAARQASAARNRDAALTHLDAATRLDTAFGADPPMQARLRRELARTADQLGSPSRSAALLQKALAAWPESDPAGAADATAALGAAQLELRRPAEAAASLRRALVWLDRAPPAPPRRLALLASLTTALLQTGNSQAAEAATAEAERLAGEDPALQPAAALSRAQILLSRSALAAAEPLLSGIAAKARPEDPVRAHALLLLATARFNRGRMTDAVESGLQAAAAYRATLGAWHPALGRVLHLLGSAYGELRDRRTAAAFFAEAVALGSRSLGADAPQVQTSLIEWAWLDLQQGDVAAAERRAGTVLRALRQRGAEEPRLAGLGLVLTGLIQEARGLDAAAVDSYRAGQASIDRAGPSGQADLGFSLVRLGRVLIRLRRLPEAAAPIGRAIATYERLGGAGTPRLADALLARAELLAAQGDRHGAIEQLRRAHAGLAQGLSGQGMAVQDEQEGGAFRRGARDVLAAQARLLLRLAGDEPDLQAEAFLIVQEALASRAGAALRQAMVRQSATDPAIAALLRQRDAASDELQRLAGVQADSARAGGPSAPAQSVLADRARQADVLAGLDAQIIAAAPALAAQLRNQAVPLAKLQSALPERTAAVVTLTTADGLLVWAVARDRSLPVVGPGDAAQVADLVRRVRAGVDLQAASLPPFDIEAARALHRMVVAPVSAALADCTSLLFVTDGALQSLPPALMLGEGDAGFLVRRYAIAVMPSLDAVAASVARPASSSPDAFLGIGDPALPSAPVLAAGRGPGELRGDLRQVLGSLQPLPETALELRGIAALFKGGATRLLVGAEATKARLTQATPSDYRIISFATHAVMAGELPGVPEPAIVMTPEGADLAQSLLTASDIARLSLDADLVLLSACNTAAPDGGPLAEGLSGLARAFLQSGARSLLVSHWAVDSRATVALTTGFMAQLQADTRVPAPVALQAAMLQMLNSPDQALHHPALWGPFVFVGMR